MRRHYGLYLFLLANICLIFAVTSSSASTVSENPNGSMTKEEMKKLLMKHTQDSALLRLVDDDCFFCKQLKCMVQETKCEDFIGETLKNIAPLVIKNQCKSCAFIEKDIVEAVTKYISQRYPEEWDKLLKLYT